MELKRILHHLAGSTPEQESPLFAETLISHHLRGDVVVSEQERNGSELDWKDGGDDERDGNGW